VRRGPGPMLTCSFWVAERLVRCAKVYRQQGRELGEWLGQLANACGRRMSVYKLQSLCAALHRAQRLRDTSLRLERHGVWDAAHEAEARGLMLEAREVIKLLRTIDGVTPKS